MAKKKVVKEESPGVTLPKTPIPKFNKSFVAKIAKKATGLSGTPVSAEDIRSCLMEQMNESSYDPVLSLIDKIQHGVPVKLERDGAEEIQRIPLDPKDIIRIELALVEYLVPKLKSVETKQELDLNINVAIKKFGREPKTIDAEYTETSDD